MFGAVVLAPAKSKVLGVFVGSCPARPMKEAGAVAEVVVYGLTARCFSERFRPRC